MQDFSTEFPLVHVCGMGRIQKLWCAPRRLRPQHVFQPCLVGLGRTMVLQCKCKYTKLIANTKLKASVVCTCIYTVLRLKNEKSMVMLSKLGWSIKMVKDPTVIVWGQVKLSQNTRYEHICYDNNCSNFQNQSNRQMTHYQFNLMLTVLIATFGDGYLVSFVTCSC